MPILKALFEAPAQDWIRFLFFLAGIILFITAAEKTRTRLGWSPEVNRKLVHVGTGVLIVFSPLFFASAKPLLWMAVLFMFVNFIGVETGLLKGMHDTRRKSFGTVFYPMTFFILVAACWSGHKAVLVLSMMILAFSDAAAAAVGELMKRPHEYRLGADKKSLEGSAAMFAASLVLVWLFLPPLARRDGIEVAWLTAGWIAFIAALISTALEAVSSSGSDNLTAPLGAAFILFFMLRRDSAANLQLTLGLALALATAAVSFKLKFLNPSGAVATFVLATVIFGVGGWTWAVPILLFFVSSSLLSKIGRRRKKRFDLVFEKSSTRDIGQVTANGGVAGILVILHGLFPNPLWFELYLGALAAVNADTWATELGTFSKSKPLLISNLKRAPHGTSGAVSPLGFAAAFLGSIVIAIAGILSMPSGFTSGLSGRIFGFVTAAGFMAAAADSVLGATIQAQYRCPVCNKITEKRLHCGGVPTVLASGRRWISNDSVNWTCSAVGAGMVWILTGMWSGIIR
jgi:uncharacterized protein (TIGR00297 family)